MLKNHWNTIFLCVFILLLLMILLLMLLLFGFTNLTKSFVRSSTLERVKNRSLYFWIVYFLFYVWIIIWFRLYLKVSNDLSVIAFFYLRDWILFVKFKKHEKHPWRIVFSGVFRRVTEGYIGNKKKQKTATIRLTISEVNATYKSKRAINI